MEAAEIRRWIDDELRGITKPADLLRKKLEVINRQKKEKNGIYERKIAGEISESLALEILLTEIETRLEAKNANKK